MVDDHNVQADHLLVQHGPAIAAMQEQFPLAAVPDLVRFLQARKWNVAKAAVMYRAHLEWRAKTLPRLEEPTVQAEIQATLTTRKWYLLKHSDSDGRPIMVYCFRRFQELGYKVDEEIQAFVYWMEHDVLPRCVDGGPTEGKFICLIDVSGIRSPPIGFLRKMNAVTEANYPERLYRNIMFPVPGWLQSIIKGLLVFVDPVTRQKFRYVMDTKSLLELANVSQLEHLGPDVTALVATKHLLPT